MKRIVVIGGGELGKLETVQIDKEIISLSGKIHPNLLFIPAASLDSESYWQTVQKVFGDLGCKTNVLYLVKENPDDNSIKEKIFSADIIYVGGGNTIKLIETLKSKKVDEFLFEAYNKGIILCGLSAGTLCWFKSGISDSVPGKWTLVPGLGFIDAIGCVGYQREGKKEAAKSILPKNKICLALDDATALLFEDNKYTPFNINENRKIRKLYFRNEKFNETEITLPGKIRDLISL